MADTPFEDGVDSPVRDSAQRTGHDVGASNGTKASSSRSSDFFYSRADELQDLLVSVVSRLVPFVQQADIERRAHRDHQQVSTSCLVDSHPPSDLLAILHSSGTLDLPDQGTGQAGLEETLSTILKYSVNPSAPGFLDKLYAAPLPPGIVAELILAVLNTNLHVYQVSPVLSLIETHVTKALAHMFGLTGPRAGGINVQGGSASNMTSIVIARNTLFPETKRLGNHAPGRQLVMFTSEHGHYSIEKAAQQCGFGSDSVVPVPVDPITGEMDPHALETLIVREKSHGKTPFYVNATAGTTVLGSFDPFAPIAEVARRHGLWMHIDGAWGGSFVFSASLRSRTLRGCELADSIAINPHKMMGVPVTCSFLLLKDLKNSHMANTLRAGYLFHDKAGDDDEGSENPVGVTNGTANGHSDNDDDWTPPDDLADLTLQCGRRGDSLKLFLSWQYYGTAGYAAKIENAYSVACYMADLVAKNPNLLLVSTNPPPCLQICFYFAPGKKMVHALSDISHMNGSHNGDPKSQAQKLGKRNSAVTSRIAQALIPKGFMVDYAPALSHEVEKGSFFRVVVNISTTRETVERLVHEIDVAGRLAVPGNSETIPNSG
ncbi:glutamate decarboxylase [Cladophialophora yegresii CBS 114405]|uniref:Glutamate decarboxylase n=1 Tax=Cladophialophora yegresii CBS 114405 TaxID=1182544 RepID=W9WPQ2_9EURO|nr:glutamate decarboxylase [Cladophialophora yegresii CBS 114405]EXJ60344.1 glutamate decarboxylase [Cladophialophora yegresii CBS 114405]